jgi:RNA-directed DNA polymerase
VKALTTRRTIRLSLHQLLRALNPILRGWASYFRFTAAKRTFAYLGYYAWWRVIRWLRKKHPKMTWKWLRRRYRLPGPPSEAGLALYNPAAMHVLRYRYRGAQIATPWNQVNPTAPGHRRMAFDETEFLGWVQERLFG